MMTTNYLINKTRCRDCGRLVGQGEHRCIATEPLLEKFLKRIRKTDTCWIWQGWKYGNGYGGWSNKQTKKKQLAHRMSYELLIGPIPFGMLICHRCDVRDCVNPEHLQAGTQKYNLHDMMIKGRRPIVSLKAERNPSAKLTWEKVREIRSLHYEKTYKELVAQFGVGHSMIGNILQNQSWHEK